MVRKYSRKTERQSWSEQAMENALSDIREGKAGTLKASKVYGVPRTTLQRRARGINKVAKGTVKHMGSCLPTFDA